MDIAGKLNLSTKEAIYVLGSKQLFLRLRAAKWIVPIEENSRDLLWPASRLADAQARMLSVYPTTLSVALPKLAA